MTFLWLISRPGPVSHHWVGSTVESRHPHWMKLSITPGHRASPSSQEVCSRNGFPIPQARRLREASADMSKNTHLPGFRNIIKRSGVAAKTCRETGEWEAGCRDTAAGSRFLRIFPLRMACEWASAATFPITVHLVSIRFYNRDQPSARWAMLSSIVQAEDGWLGWQEAEQSPLWRRKCLWVASLIPKPWNKTNNAVVNASERKPKDHLKP